MSKMHKIAIPDGIGGTVYLDMPESDVKVLEDGAKKLGISVAELIVDAGRKRLPGRNCRNVVLQSV